MKISLCTHYVIGKDRVEIKSSYRLILKIGKIFKGRCVVSFGTRYSLHKLRKKCLIQAKGKHFNKTTVYLLSSYATE